MAVDMKQSMIQNIIAHFSNQMLADTLVEFASGFDMNRPMVLQDRIILIKKLHTIYGCNYCHIVQGIEEERWKDFAMEITYPLKIKCDQETLVLFILFIYLFKNIYTG